MVHSIKKAMKRMSVFILMFFVVSECFSQDWNSARISVLNGGSIPLTFNSIEKLKKGIEILSGTKFGISLGTKNIVGHDLTGFVLNFRTFNSQANLTGDYYTLPLNRIRVKAENVIGLETGNSLGYMDLAADWTPLFTYENLLWSDLTWVTHQLNISYECGKPESDGGNGALLGENPDYYTVEIEFELVPTGPGF